MKQTCRHFIVASVVVLFILLIVSAVNAEVTVTNATFRLVSATNGPATNDSETVPLIHFQEVPITAAIMNLARQSEINYLIDPQLFPATDDEGKPLVEPLVTFRLQNTSTREALQRMLTLRHIALIESPVSHVVRITRAGQPVNVVDASLLGLDTNNPVTATNDIIPVIQFSDVPIETGFENLIRLSEVKAVLDPRVSDYRDIVNLRWEKITAKQAIVALCENYNLSLVKDANRGVIEIKPVEAKKHHRRQTH